MQKEDDVAEILLTDTGHNSAQQYARAHNYGRLTGSSTKRKTIWHYGLLNPTYNTDLEALLFDSQQGGFIARRDNDSGA